MVGLRGNAALLAIRSAPCVGATRAAHRRTRLLALLLAFVLVAGASVERDAPTGGRGLADLARPVTTATVDIARGFAAVASDAAEGFARLWHGTSHRAARGAAALVAGLGIAAAKSFEAVGAA